MEAPKINRKNFISLVVKSAVAYNIMPSFLLEKELKVPIQALAFDAFTLFDTRSVAIVAEELFPGKGSELMNIWRTRQFEYTWLRQISKRYKDFRTVTEDALQYASAYLKLGMSEEKKVKMMQALFQMRFVPEADEILHQLRQMQRKLAILSNATSQLIETVINNSGMQSAFDFVLSTDAIKTYKPDPAAYQLAVDAFKLRKEEILFVAFGGWDAAGAKSFGYPTAWINASGLPIEQLDADPDFVCRDLTQLLDCIRSHALS